MRWSERCWTCQYIAWDITPKPTAHRNSHRGHNTLHYKMAGIDNMCSTVVLNWPQIACWGVTISSSLRTQLKINPPSIGIRASQSGQSPAGKAGNEATKAIQNKSRMMRYAAGYLLWRLVFAARQSSIVFDNRCQWAASAGSKLDGSGRKGNTA